METLDTYARLAGLAGLQVTDLVDISDQMFPTLAKWRERLEMNEADVRADIGGEGFAHFRASCDVLTKLWNQRLFGYGLIVASKREEESCGRATR
jgi:hypothetical protein